MATKSTHTSSSAQVNIPRDYVDLFARYKRPVISIKVVKGYTIIENLSSISHSLGRTDEQVISFLSKKLATSKNKNSLRGTSFTVSILEDRLEEYIALNVLCLTCSNPQTVYMDTTSTKRRCLACGNVMK